MSPAPTSDAETQKHLYDLLKDFSTAMLITTGADGVSHARPMAIAELRPDTQAYFATDARSTKVAEVNANPAATVTFQSSNEYAAMAGTVAVVSDRALVERLWSKAWKVWFPAGKSDPNLVILRFDPTSAEYWDNSGTEGLKYLFEGLKAYAQGRKPEVDASVHSKVNVGR